MTFSVNDSVSKSTWAHSAKEKTSWAIGKAFSLFKTYVCDPVERYAIGDLRHFNYEFKWNADQSFGIHRFGLLGSVVRWRPKTWKELADVLNRLDKEPNGRSPYRAVESLIKGSHFLLSDTSSLALVHRRDVLKFLKPHQYAEIAWELLQKFKTSDKSDKVCDSTLQLIAMQSVAKGMLGLDESAIEKYYSTLRELGGDFKNYSNNPLPGFLLKRTPDFKEKQEKYQVALEELLQTEVENTRRDPARKGLLAQEINKKIGQNPHVQDLNKDPELKSLVLNLLAVENLSEVIGRVYSDLDDDVRRDRIEIDQIRKEISGVIQTTSDGKEKIDPVILMDRRKMAYLDRLYQRCLHNSFSHEILIRYVQKGMECGGYRIPPRTTLAISSPMHAGTKVPTSVFSEGSRKCPGRAVAEAIFKAIVVGLIHNNYFVNRADNAEKEDIKNWGKCLVKNLDALPISRMWEFSEKAIADLISFQIFRVPKTTRLRSQYRETIGAAFDKVCQDPRLLPELISEYRKIEQLLLAELSIPRPKAYN